MKIAPSLLAANFKNLESEIQRINATNCEYVHLDIMDGHFVDNISFGFEIINSFKDILKKKMDIHLMVEDPLKYMNSILELHPDIVTFHYEVIEMFDAEKFINICHENDMKVGMAINPATKINFEEKLFKNIDLILIMSVVPGKGGQKFMKESLLKMEEIKKIEKKHKKNYLYEIDGGINSETISLINDDFELVVSGSYLFSGDMQKKIDSLLKML